MPHSIALLLTNVILCAPVFATTCESLAHLSLANGAITSATSVAPNAFVTDDSHPMLYLPAFCRVAATLTPTPDQYPYRSLDAYSRLERQAREQATADTQAKLAMDPWLSGCVAAMPWQTQIWGLRYPGSQRRSSVGHPERWADWGWRSTHEMTVPPSRSSKPIRPEAGAPILPAVPPAASRR